MERLVNKFKNAINGMTYAFRIDTGVKIQFLLALITILFCLWLDLTPLEWMIILLCIGCVICAELLNTAIEKTLDAIPNLNDKQVGHIKDISAGAVLTISIISFIIMIIIILGKGVITL